MPEMKIEQNGNSYNLMIKSSSGVWFVHWTGSLDSCKRERENVKSMYN